MSLIRVNHLTFAYEGSYDNIFEDVSFQIDTDWKLGFVGRNGRGKTTFLNLLRGKYDCGGAISAKADFIYFPFDIQNTEQMTIEIIDQILPTYEYWQLSRELNSLEVSDEVLYRPFSSLSFGEQTKVLLSVLFLDENCFPLIDEPTNHLDLHGREVVSRYLASKRGFILISHDRSFLDSCTDHILSINKTNIEVQKGNFSSYLQNKERRDNFELAENEKLSRSIKALETAAGRTARWSDKVEKTKNGTRTSGVKADKGHIGAQAAKMMKRSKSVQKRRNAAIEEKAGLLKNIERADALKIHPLTFHTDPLVLGEEISISFDGVQTALGPFSFSVNSGERIALRGKNGCGKSSLLKLILGLPMNYTGSLYRGSGLKISYVSQDTSFLQGSLTDFARQRNIDETLFLTILRKLDFERIQFTKPMEDFSGGQKKKVLIAASLCEEAHLYLWDEPLNFIDVLSRMQIENLLRTYNPSMIFVEHDRAFCDNIATRIIELE